ncbi:hypothetical protein M1307_02365, partial [Patescibacteria group bacterium]|nr:hypothetical protein [Patescibacteria group bacterium]
IKITLIATKFDDKRLRLFKFRKDELATSEVEKKETESKEKTRQQPKIDLENDIETDEELLEAESEFDIPAFLRQRN